MKVSDLLKEIEYSHIINEQDLEFSNISYNSKTAKEGDLFICLKGEHTDGHNFAKMAYEKKLSGFEFLIGIPATLGGAIYMNAKGVTLDIEDSFFTNNQALGNPNALDVDGAAISLVNGTVNIKNSICL